jgi:hypothetical protein
MHLPVSIVQQLAWQDAEVVAEVAQKVAFFL